MTSQARTWGMLCHLSAICGYFFPFGHLLGPFIVWLIKKNEHEFVDDQGREALNFQLSMTIYMIVAGILIFFLIGIPILIALIVANIVFIVIASVKANDGVRYRYPLTIRFLR